MNASVAALRAASQPSLYPEERLAAEIEKALLAGESVEVASAFCRPVFRSISLDLSDFAESGFDTVGEWAESLVDSCIEFLEAEDRVFSAAHAA